MKQIVFLLGFFLFQMTAFSQVENVGYKYRMLPGVEVYQYCDKFNKRTEDKVKYIPMVHGLKKDDVTYKKKGKKIKFHLIDIIEDTIFIQFYNYYEKNFRFDYEELPEYYNASNNREVFYVLKGPKHRFTYSYKSVDWGILSLPIKLRFGFKKDGLDIPFDVSKDISVAPYLGYSIFNRKKYERQKFSSLSLSVGLFAGPGFVTVYKSNSKNENFGENPLEVLSFTSGIGIVGAVNTFQIGLFSGMDWVGGNDVKQWYYHGRPWLSLSVGYKFLNKEEISRD